MASVPPANVITVCVGMVMVRDNSLRRMREVIIIVELYTLYSLLIYVMCSVGLALARMVGMGPRNLQMGPRDRPQSR